MHALTDKHIFLHRTGSFHTSNIWNPSSSQLLCIQLTQGLTKILTHIFCTQSGLVSAQTLNNSAVVLLHNFGETFVFLQAPTHLWKWACREAHLTQPMGASWNRCWLRARRHLGSDRLSSSCRAPRTPIYSMFLSMQIIHSFSSRRLASCIFCFFAQMKWYLTEMKHISTDLSLIKSRCYYIVDRWLVIPTE